MMRWYLSPAELAEFVRNRPPRADARTYLRVAQQGRRFADNRLIGPVIVPLMVLCANLALNSGDSSASPFSRVAFVGLCALFMVVAAGMTVRAALTLRMINRLLREGIVTRGRIEGLTRRPYRLRVYWPSLHGEPFDPTDGRAEIVYRAPGEDVDRAARLVFPRLTASEATRLQLWFDDGRDDLWVLFHPSNPYRVLLLDLWLEPEATAPAPAADGPRSVSWDGAAPPAVPSACPVAARDPRGMRVTPALAAFLALPPPRQPTPATLRLLPRNTGSTIATLLLGVLIGFPCLYGFLRLFPWTWPVQALMAAGVRAEASGELLGGERVARGDRSIRLFLRFVDGNGKTVRTVCYAEADDPAVDTSMNANGIPTIKAIAYFPPWPSFARVRGARLGATNTHWAVLAILAFGVACGVWLTRIAGGNDALGRRLLREGVYARGRIEAIHQGVDTARGGRFVSQALRASVRFALPDGGYASAPYVVEGGFGHRFACKVRHWFERQEEIGVLYLPDAPTRRVLIVDLLENRPPLWRGLDW